MSQGEPLLHNTVAVVAPSWRRGGKDYKDELPRDEVEEQREWRKCHTITLQNHPQE